MRRRDFIKVVAGSAVSWPLAARAQQADKKPLIAVLMNRAANDPEGQARLAAFLQGLQETGWSEGRNVSVEVRWGADNVELERKYAAELVALAPHVILAAGTLGVTAVQGASRTLPIIFAAVTDPVGGGFVDFLARPGGQATGFMIYEYSLAGKWVELLKADCAECHARGSAAGSYQLVQFRHIRRDSGRRTAAWLASNSRRPTRCRRD